MTTGAGKNSWTRERWENRCSRERLEDSWSRERSYTAEAEKGWRQLEQRKVVYS